MTIAEIVDLESQRTSPEQYGVVHLVKEQSFYRAHDWSAWLMSMFPVGEAANNPLRVSAKKLKDGYIEAWVGFPVTSLGKFIPDDGSVVFTPVSDNQIDVTVSLPEELLSEDSDTIRALVDEWKGQQPLNDGKKQKREEREVADVAPKVTRISDVLGRILSFPLESKSPMEAYDFLRILRQQVAGLF